MESPSENEGNLHPYSHRQEFVADLGQRALEIDDLDRLLYDASVGVVEALDSRYCAVFERRAEEQQFLLRQAHGWPDEVVGRETVPTGRDSHAGYTVHSGEAVIFDDLQAGDRFTGSDLLTSRGIVSGIGVIIGPADEPWGVLGTYTTTECAYTVDDIHFLRTVANVLASAIQRFEVERRLDTETALTDQVVETTPVGIAVIDGTGQIQDVDQCVEDLLQHSKAELLGKSLWEMFPEAAEKPVIRESFHTAMEAQEPTSAELYDERLGFWVEANLYPSETGVSVYFRDITERKQQEERFQAFIEHSTDIITVLDSDGTYQYQSPSGNQVIGHEAEELIGKDAFQFVHPDDREAILETFYETLADPEMIPTVEYRLQHKDGSWRWMESVGNNQLANPAVEGFIVNSRDITERKEREQELQKERDLIERIVETSPIGIVILGADGSFNRVNERAEEIVGYEATDFDDIGQALDALQTVTPEGDPYPLDEHPVTRVLSRGETVHGVEAGITRSDDERRWLSVSGTPLRVDGTLTGAVITFADITERREVVSALRERERQLSAVMGNIPGMVYRCQNEPDWPMEFVSDGCVELTGYDPDVLKRNEVRFGEDIIVEADQNRLWEVVQARVKNHEPFMVTYRIETADGSLRWVRESGRGIFDDDGTLQSLEGVILDVTEWKEYEEELQQRRAELERLNQLNELVQELVRRLIREPSRTEIEQTVCDRLAASDFYESAWVGERSVTEGQMTPRAWAGIEKHVAATISDSSTGDEDVQNVIERTLETRRRQVVEDVETEIPVDDCRRKLLESGIESGLAVPIQYRDTLYGVLVVCAGQPDAFDERHQTRLEEFGETLGFAITAAERKEALLTDESVELAIRVRDPDHFFFTVTADVETVLTVRGLTTHSENAYLVYATVTNGSAEAILERALDSPDIEHARLVESHDDEALLEFVAAVPRMITTFAEYGATVTTATAENHDATLTVLLPPSVNVRAVVDAFQSTFPDSKVLTKRTVHNPARTSRGVSTALLDQLTDRQREALQAAYFSGYYERPRNSSGNDLADALGVSPSTFHQHRQAGLRKLLAAVFDEFQGP